MHSLKDLRYGELMSLAMTRRGFLAGAMASYAWAASGGGAKGESKFLERKLHNPKGVRAEILPPQLGLVDGLRLARESGFEQVEVFTTLDDNVAQQIKNAAQEAGISIGSVANRLTNWRDPLSSSDPEVVEKALRAQVASLRNAHFYHAHAALVIPGVVNPTVPYRSAWSESRRHIEQLIPVAERLKVVMALEETANQSKFLLSPLEFAAYIDDFKSPYVKAYFDVANIMPIGYPQDWIHALGKRIAKVHVKDYDPKTRSFVNLGDGAVDWPAVKQAFMDIGYSGTFTVELSRSAYIHGGSDYLRDISRRLDRLLLS